MTDDQTLESMRAMPKTRRMLGGAGTTFENFFASYSLCCPSRATLLTGQHAHNHGVLSNRRPSGGGYTRLDHANTLVAWLQRAGYHTTHIGKYLNGYGPRAVPQLPPGWSDWQALVDNSTYRMYGYTINDNEGMVAYGNAPQDYQTDVLAERAVQTVHERSQGDQPFFLSVMPLAVHNESGGHPPRAAPRHAGIFADEPLPRSPSFNEPDVSDKPTSVRSRSPLGSMTPALTELYRARLAALQAVDDLVERVVGALDQTGQLSNTVVIFTSDNGYLLGEHRLKDTKIHPYEESMRIPLIIAGPGFPPGAIATQLTSNVDLAPTIAQLARATPERVMDGRPLRPLSVSPSLGRKRDLLFEATVEAPFKAVRTDRYLYVERATREVELYDLHRDPYQLQSRHADPAYNAIEAELKARLARLRSCAGTGCSRGT